MCSHPVGVVHHDDVARDDAVETVLLEGDADSVRDGAEKQRNRLGHRRHRVVQRGRAGDGGGDVRRLADLRRERVGDELAADVFHDVTEAAGEHRCREAVTLVELFELGVAEVPQCGTGATATSGLGRHHPYPLQEAGSPGSGDAELAVFPDCCRVADWHERRGHGLADDGWSRDPMSRQ